LSLLIRGKGCGFFSLFVLYNESSIRKRFRTGSARPDWPGLNWAKRNHAFDPGSRSGLCLPERKTCSHGQQRQDDWQFSKSHHQMYAHNCVLVNNDEARMTKHEGNPNDTMTNDRDVVSSFGLRASFVIRHYAPQRSRPACRPRFNALVVLPLDGSFVALKLLVPQLYKERRLGQPSLLETRDEKL
jgi:hypothetical protein